MKRTSFLLIIGVAVAFLSLGYTGYQFYQSTSSVTRLTQITGLIKEQNTKLLQYQNNDLEQAIAAKEMLAGLSLDSVKWSEVIKEIRQTLPNGKKGDALVEVLSYSGSGGNLISMNVKTMPGSEAPYLDVAKLIQAFNESAEFKDTFVPSISTGTDVQGKETLTFMLTTEYVPKTPISIN